MQINYLNCAFCLFVCLLPQSFHAMPAYGDKTVISLCRDLLMHYELKNHSVAVAANARGKQKPEVGAGIAW